MADILPLVLSGAIGGIAANFLATFLWQWYTKPVLEFQDTAKGKFLSTERGNLTKMVFRAPVENTGRSSATNCKAELRMRGWHDRDRYEVQTPIIWTEEETAIIDINRGEQPTCQILLYEAAGPTDVQISIPEGTSWQNKAPIMRHNSNDEGEVEHVEYFEGIPKDLFVNHIDWEEQIVTVTSHNAEIATAEIEVGKEINSSEGIKGNQISLHQK